jgi:hypothetical protein
MGKIMKKKLYPAGKVGKGMRLHFLYPLTYGKLNPINYTRIMEVVNFITFYLVIMDLSIRSFACVFM